MFALVQEKGDGYFYGGEDVMDRISESSGRQHHQRHHHGSSLLCTAGLEVECSFCGSNSAASSSTRDGGDVLAWLNDEGGSRRAKTISSSSRHRSSSGSGGGSSSQGAGRRGSTSSLLSGLNLADPFSVFGSSMSSASAAASSSAASAASAAAAAAAAHGDLSAPPMFLSRRKVNPYYHSPPLLWAAEQQLERSVRLCDTRGYCDTLCVTSDLLEQDDGHTFLTLLDRISNGEFLSTPCYCTYDKPHAIWLWDVTAWFRKRGFYSLGTFLANKIEMALWMRYWEHTGVDPRKVPSGKAYVAGGLVRERLSSKSPLAHFWSSLPLERRSKMLAKLGMLVEQQAASLQAQYLNLTQPPAAAAAAAAAASAAHSSRTALTDASNLSDDESQTGSVSTDSTPTQRTRRLQTSSSSASSSSALSTDTASASNSAASTTLSRTRSHSLPRRRPKESSSHGLQPEQQRPPASPTTPSSSNSAPTASSVLRPSSSQHAGNGGAGADSSSSGAAAGFVSPWSSMHSSFASSLTTSPSASPSFAPQAPPTSFSLHSASLAASAHHLASPQAGQLTPNLAMTQPHHHGHGSLLLRSPTPLSPLLARAAVPISGQTQADSASSSAAAAAAAAGGPFASTSPPAFPSSALLPRTSTWDRSRSGLSSDLIRSLMATAEAHELKASLANQKHKHLVGAFAALPGGGGGGSGSGAGSGSTDASLSKAHLERLKELDYDFTMTGLQLLANLLSALANQNKRPPVNAMLAPRKGSSKTAAKGGAAAAASASTADASLSAAASSSVSAEPEVPSTQPTLMRAQSAANAAGHSTASSAAAADASSVAPAASPSLSSSTLVVDADGALTDLDAADSPEASSQADVSEETAASLQEDESATASGAAAVGAPAAAAADSPTDTSSAIASVVGLNINELLLFAERSAASKSLALTAARIESLKNSWPRHESIDDRSFIELLFSSPLARARTSLDKIIRRIGLLLQACYAEQIGVDLIMGEESEEGAAANQASNANSLTRSTAAALAASFAAGSGGSKAKKDKKKLKKRKLKEKKKLAGGGGGGGGGAGSKPEGEGEAAAGEDDDAATDVEEDAQASVTTESQAADEKSSSADPSAGAAKKQQPSGGDVAPLTIRTNSNPLPHATPSRSASAEPSCHTVPGFLPTRLSRSFSSHSTAEEEDEPWQRVARKGERSSGGGGGGHSGSGSGHNSAKLANHSTPTKARAKDDSDAEQRQQQQSYKSLHTPPPSGRRHIVANATLPPPSKQQHQHTHSVPSPGSGLAAAAPASASSTPSTTSPRFSSSLSFSNSFAASTRPASWSAAASALRNRSSTSTSSASISPASTGHQTPTLMPADARLAAASRSGGGSLGAGVGGRAKDDSFAPQKSVATERRASDASLLMSYSLQQAAIKSPSATAPVLSPSSSQHASSAAAAVHSRNLSAGSTPLLASSHAGPLDSSYRPSSSISRSPLIKSSSSSGAGASGSSTALVPPHSPLLPMPPAVSAAASNNASSLSLGAGGGSSYGRTSSLHLAKPVPIHNSSWTSLSSYSHPLHAGSAAAASGPRSVGVSFSSVPAHKDMTSIRELQMQRRQRHFAEYVHGTDDVTQQAYEQRQAAAGAQAAHQRQQLQSKQQYHQPSLLHSQHLPPQQPQQQQPPHARVPRPSSARRALLDSHATAQDTSAVEFSAGAGSAVAGRPRSNSEGEECLRMEFKPSAAAVGKNSPPIQPPPHARDAQRPQPQQPPPQQQPQSSSQPLASDGASRPSPFRVSAVQSSAALPLSPLSQHAPSSSAPPLMLPANAVDSRASAQAQEDATAAGTLSSASAEPLSPTLLSNQSRDEAGTGRPRAASSAAAADANDPLHPQSALAQLDSAGVGSPAYHASVQTAQAYHKRNGMQFPPWLNASNLQLLAFIHNTSHASGDTPPHTRTHSGNAAVLQSSASSPGSTAPSPLHRSTSHHGSDSGSTPSSGSSSTGGSEPESRRPSLSALMPNFLVMPNISGSQSSMTQQQQQQQHPSLASQPRTHSMPLVGSNSSGSNNGSNGNGPAAASWQQVPAHAQFIRVLSPTNSSSNHNLHSSLTRVADSNRLPPTLMPSFSPSPQPMMVPCPPLPSLPLPQPHQGDSWSLRDSWKLHDEICVFTAYVSDVTQLRQPILLSMINKVRECVLGLWPQACVECYGSFMTGLCLPTSDLDLVLMGVPVPASQGLGLLASVLRKQRWLLSLNAISTAKVPVIKLLGSLEGEEIVVDITFGEAPPPASAPATNSAAATASTGNGESIAATTDPSASSSVSPSAPAHTGVASVNLIREFLRVFPALRPLSLVLKQFLYERGLANTYTGGLNSYCLILMIVGFLQSRPTPYRAFQHQMQAQAHMQSRAAAQQQQQQQQQLAQTQSHRYLAEAAANTSSTGYVPVRIRAQLISQMATASPSPPPPPYSPLAATTTARVRSPSSVVSAAVQRIEEKEREEKLAAAAAAALAGSKQRWTPTSASQVAARVQAIQQQQALQQQQQQHPPPHHSKASSSSMLLLSPPAPLALSLASPSPQPSPSPSLPSPSPNSPGNGAYRFPATSAPASPHAGHGSLSNGGGSNGGSGFGVGSSSMPSPHPLSLGSAASPPPPGAASSVMSGYTENLGALLIDFLHFYGCTFDFGAMAIAVHMPPTWNGGQGQQQQQAQAQGYAQPSPALGAQPAPSSAASTAGGGSSVSSSVPAAPSTGPPSAASFLQLPVRTCNYLSLMQPGSANLSFPSGRTLAEAARLHATVQPEEDLWGHGVFLALSGESRVLVISDPLFGLLANNIGKSVFAMWRIRNAFDEGFKLLSAKFSPHGTAPTLLARIIQKMAQQKRRQTPQQTANNDGAAAPPSQNAAPSPSHHTAHSTGGGGFSSSGSGSIGGTPGSGGGLVRDSSGANVAPMRGLFHITLPSFFNKPADKYMAADT